MQDLRGLPVIKAMTEKIQENMAELAVSGIVPALGIVRVGERDDDIAYEQGIIKRFSASGAIVKVVQLPADCTQEDLESSVTTLNADKDIHGILMFRPLPKHLNEDKVQRILSTAKDVDCITAMSYAGLFIGNKTANPPCTPQAVVELLDYYNIDVTGKKVVIVGRSLVVGKPLAVLLLARHATITICHTRTLSLAEECRQAEILIACAGVAKMIKSDFVTPNQTVIDVGINMDGDKLCGDVDYENVAPIVAAITPVPGGVGTVTTSVLLKHTVLNAKKLNSM